MGPDPGGWEATDQLGLRQFLLVLSTPFPASESPGGLVKIHISGPSSHLIKLWLGPGNQHLKTNPRLLL